MIIAKHVHVLSNYTCVATLNNILNPIAYQKNDCLDAETLELLMRECASAMVAAGMNARAVSVLEELRKRHPKDLRVLAQLITAYATVDPVAAQKVNLIKFNLI